MSNNTITLKGTDAINLSDIAQGGTAKSLTLSPGKYAVNLESTVKFHDSVYDLDQVVLFNTAPLETNNSERWYFVVNSSQGIQISVEENEPVYAVILDQVTSADNKGSLKVTFSLIS